MSVRMRRMLPAALLALAAAVVTPAPAGAASQLLSRIDGPAAGSEVPAGVPLTVTGGATNGESGGVVRIELSVDGGSSWTVVSQNSEGFAYTFTPTSPGPLRLVTRAATRDQLEVPGRSTTLKVTGPDCPCVLRWPDPGPATHEEIDDLAVEVGLRFQVERPGAIAGLMLRRYPGNTGPQLGHLWSGAGDLLAQAASELVDGYPYLRFASPVPVEPGQDYVVSYFTPSGFYASAENYFDDGTELATGPFLLTGQAGVYRYGGGFPDQSWNGSNYSVEPVFVDLAR
jgi:uncharacterized protein DUF4082/Big-like domain-containing protein